MTTTPVTLLSKRSGNASDRPLTTTVQNGELAINFAASDNGIYFKDSTGDIRKVVGTHYGATAPNSTPAGQTGNSVGETWVDSSTSSYYLQVWNGSSWQKIGAAFADQANIANTATSATTANTATVANSAIVASGALEANLASGIAVVLTLPTAYDGGVVYLNSGASGLYISANGGWILT